MKPAIEGGAPVRATPLPPSFPGAIVLGPEERAAVTAVLGAKSPFRYYGPDMQHAVRRFEARAAEVLGAPYLLGVSSCTAALICALKALGIGYGDKVIVPANTWVATAGAVICANAVPVFADIDESLNIDPASLEAKFDEEVRAIIVVPYLGNPCDMDAIMAVAGHYGLPVIEDVAQSCGSSYKGRACGSIGSIGTLSFQMNKVLTAGEGGAVLTSDPDLFARMARYHDQGFFREAERYGLSNNDEDAFAGQNYRMSELTGAVLYEQFGKLKGMIANMRLQRDAIRDELGKRFPEMAFRASPDPAGDIGAYLGIRLPSKDMATRFVDALNLENIQTGLPYGGKPVYLNPQILHQRTAERTRFPFDYPFKREVVYQEDDCPRALDLMARTALIPISPVLSSEDVGSILTGITRVYRWVMDQHPQQEPA